MGSLWQGPTRLLGGSAVLLIGFPAGPLQANCYLIAPAEGAACAIVDPGQEVTEQLADVLRQYQLTPAGVLLTHGHFDHVFSAASIGTDYQVPVWIHPADRALLSDPLKGVGSVLAGLLA